MLRCKKFALEGVKNIDLTSLWGIFLWYQVVRLAVWAVRLRTLDSRARKDAPPVKAHNAWEIEIPLLRLLTIVSAASFQGLNKLIKPRRHWYSIDAMDAKPLVLYALLSWRIKINCRRTIYCEYTAIRISSRYFYEHLISSSSKWNAATVCNTEWIYMYL